MKCAARKYPTHNNPSATVYVGYVTLGYVTKIDCPRRPGKTPSRGLLPPELGRYPGEVWGKKYEIWKCVFIFSKSETVVV